MLRYLLPSLLLLLGTCASAPEKDEPAARPNVVFVLADDFGIVDAQGYAEKFAGLAATETFYKTPSLNRLMAGGVSFSQAYATQLCSPTRAGILTGKFAPRLGFMTAMPLRETYYNSGLEPPEGYFAHDVLDHRDAITIERAWDNATSNSALPTGAPDDRGEDVLSIPEALPDYDAAFIGKWHLGGFGAAGHQPADHGFEPLAYYDAGGSAYFNWQPSWNNRAKNRYPDMPQEEWEMGTAGPPSGEKYLTDDLTERALDYLDARAKATDQKPFFLYLCHFAVHAPYQAEPAVIAEFKDSPRRNVNGHFDPTYAAMVARLDHSVGRLLDKLEATGLADNTLFIFMSDNGGIDHKVTPKPHGTDNSPFMGGKACLTEGGIRVPLILYWKDKITGGRWVDTPVDYTDLYPTIVSAAGYDIASITSSQGLDGQSLLPLVDGDPNRYDKLEIYWHYPFNVIYNSPYDGYSLTPHSAIRVGDHKLIYDWHGRLHLYDLATDPFEDDDLADTDPELRDQLFQRLREKLDAEVDRRYWPVLNPAYNPNKEVREEAFVNLME